MEIFRKQSPSARLPAPARELGARSPSSRYGSLARAGKMTALPAAISTVSRKRCFVAATKISTSAAASRAKAARAALKPSPLAKPPNRSFARSSSLDAQPLADIARLVDHDAAVELWERYKRGEKNASPAAFNLPRRARRRSRTSAANTGARPSSRETVDRYIEEFERLLDQVGRDDRGQGLTRTYLASGSGKVYAAGSRIGEDRVSRSLTRLKKMAGHFLLFYDKISRAAKPLNPGRVHRTRIPHTIIS